MKRDAIVRDDSQEIDIKEYLFYFLDHWKYFLVGLLVCLCVAFFYISYVMPTYQVTSTIMVKDEKRGGNFVTELSVFEDINALNNSNTDNEVEVLRSKTLIKNVIYTTQIYKQYIGKNFWKEYDLFDESPLFVEDSLFDVKNLSYAYVMTVRPFSDSTVSLRMESNECVLLDTTNCRLPLDIQTEKGTLTLQCRDWKGLTRYNEMRVSLIPPMSLARSYLKNLKIMPVSKNSSVVNLRFNTTNTEKGIRFLDALISMYNVTAIEEKNEVAAKTAQFIEERVDMLKEELGITEHNMEEYKKKEGLTNLVSNAQMSVAQATEYEQKRVANETQLNLVQSLRSYLSTEGNRGTVIPANVGLTDAGLVAQINQYNQLLLSRNRLMRTTSENNPVVLSQTSQIEELYDNIVLLVNNVEGGLKIMQSDLHRQYEKYKGQIYKAPTQERLYEEIDRQRQIQRQLFLMLLQKREENGMAMAATVNKAKVIEESLAEPNPVSPKRSLVLFLTLCIAFVLTVIVLLLKKYFSVQIANTAQLERENLTELPVLADVPLFTEEMSEKQTKLLKVEAFRLLRTNIQFMLKGKSNKVVLFTSFVPNEGKTFVSANTAISFASLDKRVVVIGADIRNPELMTFFDEDSSKEQRGLSTYLSSDDMTIDDLVQHSKYKNLDVVSAGPTPPNSTELLSSERWDALITELKERYDYVLIDSAPVAIVSDTLVLSRVADLTLFIFRANSSNKNWFKSINNLSSSGRLSNVSVAVNCVKMDSGKNAYGNNRYGYGYGYGYGEKSYSKYYEA